MTTANFVKTTGLILDIIGFLFLWKYGLSRDPEVGDSWGRDEKLSKCYTSRSNVGVGLIITGFITQLLSNFMK